MFNEFNRDNALLNLFVSQIKIDFGKELYFVMFFSSKHCYTMNLVGLFTFCEANMNSQINTS